MCYLISCAILVLSILACLNTAQSISVTANLPTHYYHSPNFGVMPKVHLPCRWNSTGQSDLETNSTGPH